MNQQHRSELAYGGKDYGALQKTHLVVIGDNETAALTCLGAGGLGVKKTTHLTIAPQRSNLLDYVQHARTPQDFLREATYTALQSAPAPPIVSKLSPDIIVSTHNNRDLLHLLSHYPAAHNIPHLHILPNQEGCDLITQPHHKSRSIPNPMYDNSTLSSIFAAGIVLEQIKKSVCTKTKRNAKQKRTSCTYNTQGNTPYTNRGQKCLIAGAGGLGMYAALCAGSLGYGQIDILDADAIESTNIDRQFLYANNVGSSKASTLATILDQLYPHTRFNAIHKKIGTKLRSLWVKQLHAFDLAHADEQTKQRIATLSDFNDLYYPSSGLDEHELVEQNYSIVFGCVDNKYARLWLDSVCSSHDILYIDGGTSPTRGQWRTNQHTRLRNKVDLINQKPHSISCAHTPQGSVCMSNMVVASSMVAYGTWLLHNQEENETYMRYDAHAQTPVLWRSCNVS